MIFRSTFIIWRSYMICSPWTDSSKLTLFSARKIHNMSISTTFLKVETGSYKKERIWLKIKNLWLTNLSSLRLCRRLLKECTALLWPSEKKELSKITFSNMTAANWLRIFVKIITIKDLDFSKLFNSQDTRPTSNILNKHLKKRSTSY